MSPSSYYAVIFTFHRRLEDPPKSSGVPNYADLLDELEKTAKTQPGYLGREKARTEDGFGISLSYWKDHASLHAWKANARHTLAQRLGQKAYYLDYKIRVAKVERAYAWSQEEGAVEMVDERVGRARM
ncbi:hypothetical protein M427DRAFT_44806 [Gonapodya prolifera JEL478]|uniref:ABM domain-containing protein n=1 Tax=Gonapodya prolifera (strain JEL478) TaxID=1344416 RepID=A0A139ADJ8_GONPJ|nr:hypothetical protein M427DRAFT_44806 [Gonapodya prolifera JEL478]|eukprot:KXS14828.1 hypothetical protein M427DRAFT_44806 [Gonapodya prolifera JEL478]